MFEDVMTIDSSEGLGDEPPDSLRVQCHDVEPVLGNAILQTFDEYFAVQRKGSDLTACESNELLSVMDMPAYDPDGIRDEDSSDASSAFDSLIKPRRMRNLWSEEEFRDLERGVEKYGVGKWAKILRDKEFSFRPDRTIVDLKDKWRNVKKFVPYSDNKKRKFILLNKWHLPVYSANNTIHYFRNRWPREAALKVASRSEFYEKADGQKADEIEIYLNELVGDRAVQQPSQTVHVFLGTRQKQPVPNKFDDASGKVPKKFQGRQTMWIPHIRKLREEKLINNDVFINHAFAEHEFL